MQILKPILFVCLLSFAAPIFAQETFFDSALASNIKASASGRFQAEGASATRAVPFAADAASTKKFVLTRLEEICEGTILDRGDSISVRLENGGSISVSKLDVLFVADSRAEIFEFQKTRTRSGSVKDALHLADWANRRRLGPEGIAFLEATIAASDSPDARRALEEKLNELQNAEKIRAEIARTLAARDAQNSNVVDASVSASSSVVAPLGTPSASSSNDAANASDAELERWAKQVPFAALERFGRKAQPILQKRCATTDCHNGANPNAAGYVLQPKTVGGAATRLALLRNLRETFDFVDFENPNRSPILTHPAVVDANGVRVYPFGEDRASSKDCDAFVDWISSLNDGKLGRYVHSPSRVRAAESVASRSGSAARYDLVASESSENVETTNISGTLDAPEASNFAALFDSDEAAAKARGAERREYVAAQSDGVIRLGSTDAARTYRSTDEDPNSSAAVLKRVGAIPERTYRDEYDPAIFNARYQSGDSTRRY